MLNKRKANPSSTQVIGGKPTTLYFTGPNPKNQSGVSWKLWRIRRAGCVVVISWGPARIVKRRPVFIYEKRQPLTNSPPSLPPRPSVANA
jgi:hypothetical protein